MSKRPNFLISLGFAVLTLGAVASSGPALGQPAADDSAVVLGEVRARYERLRGLRARFEQRFRHRLHQREDRWRGRVSLQRPGRVRFDYDVPRGRVIASDGTRLVSYEPEPAPGQWYEQAVGDDALPVALGLLSGAPPPEGAMHVRVIDAGSTGFVGSVLELRPTEPVAAYERVWLYVDRSPARRGQVHRVMIIDHAGNTNRFDLTAQVENPALPASTFSFRPPAAARRIEP